MRIVGGALRGRRLVAPEGQAVRPTADRAREGLFNILDHGNAFADFSLSGATVVDAFAGTGALALLDPPYGADLAAPALSALAENGWLAPDAIAIVEHAAKETLEPPDGFEPIEERRYGAAVFTFLKWRTA